MHRAGVGVAEARLMLSAFRQDAVQTRYADWAALEDYCRRSADPVGRMLLRLHGDGDNAAANAAADGLCTALQVLNHLQDLVPDRASLDRDLSAEWPGWRSRAARQAFFDPENTPRRREVLDAALDRVEEELDRASALPRLLQVAPAGDPERDDHRAGPAAAGAAARGRPGAGAGGADQGGFRQGAGRGLPLGPRDAPIVAARVSRAGSSFARGMAALKGGRRRALWGVYAFCRAVDDIADGAMPEAEKRRFLAEWRAQAGRAGLRAVARAGLRARGLWRAARGMRGDDRRHGDRQRRPAAAGDRGRSRPLLPPGRRQRRRHERAHLRRAGGRGLRPALGHTFQLTNILRDVDEDALRDRVYIPRDLLDAARTSRTGRPPSIVAHPGFAAICARLGARAAAGFASGGARHPRLTRRRCCRPPS